MSEYVVIQVWTVYENTRGTDGRWLDYSRCTAKQAQTYISQKMAESGRWRAKHWITGEELNASQLARMGSDEFSRFQECEPGAGDFWNVTVELETEPGRTRAFVTSVDAWTGKKWDQLILDVSLWAAEREWVVKSLRLS